ncbi:hypothetical protein [Cryptosporangium sp. NPDC051539]|uniref:hypothetical protein n=1 Tax=Cryptosporangium sp. NPDC051539 TaxID=3363962 RepID=UPI0037BDF4BE
MSGSRLRALLGSAASVGAGYLVLGGAGYLFLAIASRVFDDAAYSALASVYLLVNIIGPGLFAAVEQETSRNVSTRLARGLDPRPVVRQLALISAGLFAGIAVLTLALSPVLLPEVLHSDAVLLVGLLLASASYAVVSVTRGNFGGRRAFGRYGTSVGTEGTVRLIAGVVLAALALGGVVATGATGGAGAYGLAFCLAPAVAVLLTARWFLPDIRGGAADGRAGSAAAPGTSAPDELPVTAAGEAFGGLARGVGLLTVAWGLSLAIANAAPVVVSGLLPNDAAGAATAATFSSAVVLARIPLFVFQGAQSLVLPSFAHAAAQSDPGALRRAVRPALLLVAAVGVAAILGSAVLGHWAGRIAFGPTFTSSNLLVTALMVGTVAGMAVQIVQPALLALGHHRWVAGGWVLGAVVFAACFALPFAPVTDAVIAQLASAAVTIAVLGAVLGRALRSVPQQSEELSDVQPA